MNEILLVNPRRKRKKRTTYRRRRRRRNPIEPATTVALATNPRKTNPLGNTLLNVGLAGGGAIASLIAPTKVFKVTGTPKYFVQGGIGLGLLTIGSKILGRKIAVPLGTGALVGLGIQVFNDLVLKPKGQSVLAQEDDELIPEIEQEEIPEIEDIEPEPEIQADYDEEDGELDQDDDEMDQEEDVVLIPEEQISDIEPETTVSMDDQYAV